MYGHSNLDQGSFATQGIWKESFLFDIPDSLSDIDAAPLQCAGATVFSALQGARPCDVIGVIGVGGLGHLAIQFAAKMGCRVVALSGSASKREEAASLGAHDFIATRDKTELTLARKITRLLVTTSAQPKWNTILPLLDMRAAIYPLSVDEGDFAIPYMELLLQGITVQGSLVASRHVHADMLDFAAFHGIKPVSELFPMTVEGITDAMSKLEQGQVKYRAVLVNEDVE
jgi:D-arabinose 1-dehydrogenase-like Zn-dependent alcohol dehydrogenase